MALITTLSALLRDWLDRAFPTALAPSSPPERADEDENTRRSINDVTLEQLGISHWSCHTLL
ncbi:hypothetical protein [Bosea sp. BIWAKO-01]|uniref:hypothetical protein n=1 Tax=Bosea sp. BIWAKO-01 TaxID=506668 RepID=UPI0008537F3F|nr:hypothetical protein [Bosea sp. BIWAKO-01]GAU81680.1 hypothetical protein BIWAKO_01581 [Bosea sp. BIWAKO-01]